MMERILEVASPDLIEQRNRIAMMLEMITTVTTSTTVTPGDIVTPSATAIGATPTCITPTQLESVYDGLEAIAHFKEDGLIRLVVCCSWNGL